MSCKKIFTLFDLRFKGRPSSIPAIFLSVCIAPLASYLIPASSRHQKVHSKATSERTSSGTQNRTSDISSLTKPHLLIRLIAIGYVCFSLIYFTLHAPGLLFQAKARLEPASSVITLPLIKPRMLYSDTRNRLTGTYPAADALVSSKLSRKASSIQAAGDFSSEKRDTGRLWNRRALEKLPKIKRMWEQTGNSLVCN